MPKKKTFITEIVVLDEYLMPKKIITIKPKPKCN